MLNSNKECLKCKQITNYFSKIITTDKMYILEKNEFEISKL